jgi:Ca2+:H+ antiporter
MVALLLAPIAIVLSFVGIGSVPMFVLAAAALIPLAWLIGESTEHASHHTGPGVGGFLNASFGNAPELIIALFAVNSGLTDVVRGSLVGSVIGNLLLVLGASLIFGGRGQLDRYSSLLSLGLIIAATAVFLIPAIPGFSGDPDRHSVAVISLPVAIVLLLVYLVVTTISLRRHRQLHHVSDDPKMMDGWSFRHSLAVLGGATAVTVWVAEILVGELEGFAHAAGLSEFFIAIVIVAIVGNAAEHGGAVVVAARGNIKLAGEIALSSSAQVAVFLIPAVAIISWAIEPLALSFRPIEMAALGGATIFTAILLFGGRTSTWRGVALVVAYVALAATFFVVGDRDEGESESSPSTPIEWIHPGASS